MTGAPRSLLAFALLLAACASPELRRVEVHVTARGRPVAGAEVDGFGSGSASHQRTDVMGKAELVTRALELTVMVRQPGCAYASRTVRVGGGLRVDVALEPESPLGGRVVDAAGRPVRRASLEAWGQGRMAMARGEDGAFAFRGLGPGRYEVRVRGGGVFDAPADHEVEAPAEDARLALGRGGAIELRVVPPPGTPSPLESLPSVSLERWEAGRWEVARRWESSFIGSPDRWEGIFLGQLPRGRYRVTLRVDGVGARISGALEVLEGQTTPLTLELRRVGSS